MTISTRLRKLARNVEARSWGLGRNGEVYIKDVKRALVYLEELEDEVGLYVTDDVRDVLEAVKRNRDVRPNQAARANSYYNHDLKDREREMRDYDRLDIWNDFRKEMKFVGDLLAEIEVAARHR